MIQRRIKKLELAVAPEQKVVVVQAGEDYDKVIQNHLEPGMTVDNLIILRVVYDVSDNRERLDNET